jgi:hypothetical protein
MSDYSPKKVVADAPTATWTAATSLMTAPFSRTAAADCEQQHHCKTQDAPLLASVRKATLKPPLQHERVSGKAE